MTDRQLKNRIEKIEALKQEVELLNQQVEELQEQVKTALGDTEEVRVGKWKVLWKWRQGTRFDKTAMGKAYPEILKQYTIQKAPERFFRIDEVKA